ncbi:MAG: TonB family protein [Candidatus Omnitrophica bacterium]|nr:TonB family protein [Candidatus Omnitrophota bacterium]
MNNDKTFIIALIISFISHGFLFFPGNSFSLTKKMTQVETTYIPQIERSRKKTIDAYSKPARKFVKKVSSKTSNYKKVKVKPAVKAEKKKTKLQQTAKEEKAITTAKVNFSKKEEYPDYHQLLKAKIKNYIVYPGLISQGEVHLSFTLTSDGQLKIIRIDEKKSSSNVLLRMAALDSIKKANPFPPFPKNLKQKEATFNVTISFKNK